MLIAMNLPNGPLFPEYGALRRVAVCRPAFYQLRQPINVIQARHVAAARRISPDRAAAEHAELVSTLHSIGAEIVEVEPDARFPYQINVRDAGLATSRGLIVGRFRLSVRQGEEELVSRAAKAIGAQVLGNIQGGAFEGGDFVSLDAGRGAVGLGPRTEAVGLQELRKLLGPATELIGVRLETRYLHLDMVFNVVAEKVALVCSTALAPDFLSQLRQGGFRLLEVSDDEVFGHGCNVLALGGGRIISHSDSRRVNNLLRSEGLEVSVVNVSELAKSGGGPRCLTLPLERAPA
jgi:N-dimethylarginine dimethylaminohydrolase